MMKQSLWHLIPSLTTSKTKLDCDLNNIGSSSYCHLIFLRDSKINDTYCYRHRKKISLKSLCPIVAGDRDNLGLGPSLSSSGSFCFLPCLYCGARNTDGWVGTNMASVSWSSLINTKPKSFALKVELGGKFPVKPKLLPMFINTWALERHTWYSGKRCCSVPQSAIIFSYVKISLGTKGEGKR